MSEILWSTRILEYLICSVEFTEKKNYNTINVDDYPQVTEYQ